METGGFKGRTRGGARRSVRRSSPTVSASQLDRIVAEYGMTELTSQYYDAPWSRTHGERVKIGPPWLRPRSSAPAGRAVADGEIGALRHVDLANRGRRVAIQTEDLAAANRRRRVRAARPRPDAPLRGCSLDAEDFLAVDARPSGAHDRARSPMPPGAGATPTFRRAFARPRRSRQRTGYTLPVVEYALDRCSRGCDARRLERRSPKSSDRSMRSTDSSSARAAARARTAPARVVVVSSETTIGVAIVPAIFALCAKCDGSGEGSRGRAWSRRSSKRLPRSFRSCAKARATRGPGAAATRRRGPRPAQRRRRRRIRADESLARSGACAARRALRRVRTSRQHRLRQRATALGERADARAAGRGAARDSCSTTARAACRCTCSSSSAAVRSSRHAFCALLIDAATAASVEFPAGKMRSARASPIALVLVFAPRSDGAASCERRRRTTTLVFDPPHARTTATFAARFFRSIRSTRPTSARNTCAVTACRSKPLRVATPSEALARARRAARRRTHRASRRDAGSPRPGLHHGGRARIADFIRWADRRMKAGVRTRFRDRARASLPNACARTSRAASHF